MIDLSAVFQCLRLFGWNETKNKALYPDLLFIISGNCRQFLSFKLAFSRDEVDGYILQNPKRFEENVGFLKLNSLKKIHFESILNANQNLDDIPCVQRDEF